MRSVPKIDYVGNISYAIIPPVFHWLPKSSQLGTEKHSSKNVDYIEMFSMSTILYPHSQAIRNCIWGLLQGKIDCYKLFYMIISV